MRSSCLRRCIAAAPLCSPLLQPTRLYSHAAAASSLLTVQAPSVDLDALGSQLLSAEAAIDEQGSIVQVTVLHCTALYCTALYRTVPHCTALHCTAHAQHAPQHDLAVSLLALPVARAPRQAAGMHDLDHQHPQAQRFGVSAAPQRSAQDGGRAPTCPRCP